jgi:hypothetical protein
MTKATQMSRGEMEKAMAAQLKATITENKAMGTASEWFDRFLVIRIHRPDGTVTTVCGADQCIADELLVGRENGTRIFIFTNANGIKELV